LIGLSHIGGIKIREKRVLYPGMQIQVLIPYGSKQIMDDLIRFMYRSFPDLFAHKKQGILDGVFRILAGSVKSGTQKAVQYFANYGNQSVKCIPVVFLNCTHKLRIIHEHIVF
jgi:hypothetical protein